MARGRMMPEPVPPEAVETMTTRMACFISLPSLRNRSSMALYRGLMWPVLMVAFRARREMARTCPAPSETVLSYMTAFLGNQFFSASWS